MWISISKIPGLSWVVGKNVVYIFDLLRGINVLSLHCHFTIKSQLKCHFREITPDLLSHSIIAPCFVLSLSLHFSLPEVIRVVIK